MKYKIDVVRIRENSIQLNGWVIGKTPESKAEFEVLDQNKKPLEIKCVATRRDDVSQIYYKQVYDRDYGFDIQFPYERGADYWLVIRCDGRTARVKYNEELIAKRASVAHKRMEKIRDLMNMETVHVALEFGKKHGLKALLLKSRHKLQGLDNDYDYGEWYELTRPKEEELAAQREDIRTLWLRQMVRQDGVQSLIIVVDHTGDQAQVFQAIAGAASAHCGQLPVDMIPYGTGFAAAATEDAQPFYSKG